MSFPSFSGHVEDLTPGFFNNCYDALAKQIDEETATLINRGELPPDTDVDTLRQKSIAEPMADLSLWQDYALDGDVTSLPGDGPWKILMDIGNNLYSDVYIKWKVAADDLKHVWGGSAHDSAKEYLDNTTGLLEGYFPSADSKFGFIPQVAGKLLDAYATAAAFKHDLYNLAKKASDQLDAIDKARSLEAEGVLLMVSGIALDAAGAAAGASGSVFVQGAGGVASFLGGLTFDKGKSTYKASVGGRDPREIMRSLADATKKAADLYSTAAGKVGNSMNGIWTNIEGKKSNSIRYPTATPSSNVSIDPSIQISKLFPAE